MKKAYIFWSISLALLKTAFLPFLHLLAVLLFPSSLAMLLSGFPPRGKISIRFSSLSSFHRRFPLLFSEGGRRRRKGVMCTTYDQRYRKSCPLHIYDRLAEIAPWGFFVFAWGSWRKMKRVLSVVCSSVHDVPYL